MTDPIDTKQNAYSLVWHYTIRANAVGILKARKIFPAIEKISPGEIPATWFSAHQTFEPTATKIAPNGERLATWAEMLAEDLWRFGISPTKLLPWKDLIVAANIPASKVIELEQDGLSRGANPLDWFGITRPIQLHELEAVDRFINDRWVRGTIDLDG